MTQINRKINKKEPKLKRVRLAGSISQLLLYAHFQLALEACNMSAVACQKDSSDDFP